MAEKGAPLFSPGRAYTITVHVRDDAGAPIEGATVSIAHDGLLSNIENLKTGADGRLRTEVRVGKVNPGISASRFLEYGGGLHWSRRDPASRTWDLSFVLERNTQVRLKPEDTSTGRPIAMFSGATRCRTSFKASPELEAQWAASEVRSRGGRGDQTFSDQGMNFSLWMAPVSTDFELSAEGYETAIIRVEIPRLRTPFDLTIPMRPRTT